MFNQRFLTLCTNSRIFNRDNVGISLLMSIAAIVVDLPEPVAPVIRINPYGNYTTPETLAAISTVPL